MDINSTISHLPLHPVRLQTCVQMGYSGQVDGCPEMTLSVRTCRKMQRLVQRDGYMICILQWDAGLPDGADPAAAGPIPA